MNESGEWLSNDNAAQSTTTEIRQPICAIARGALSLREPLKHIVKKRVRSGQTVIAMSSCDKAMTDFNSQHRQAARLGAAWKRLVERGQFVLAQRQRAGRGVVGGVLH
jgi:hypothetical protein